MSALAHDQFVGSERKSKEQTNSRENETKQKQKRQQSVPGGSLTEELTQDPRRQVQRQDIGDSKSCSVFSSLCFFSFFFFVSLFTFEGTRHNVFFKPVLLGEQI